MPKLATAHSLNDYQKLPISAYREHFKKYGLVDSVTLSYHFKKTDYKINIEVSHTPCNYGGLRHWWHCPKCSKRVSALYCAGRYVCRHCINANYSSQLQQPIDRIFSRLHSIRMRLGWQAGIAHGIGERPRYMHSKTFDRLVNEHEQLTDKLIRTFY